MYISTFTSDISIANIFYVKIWTLISNALGNGRAATAQTLPGGGVVYFVAANPGSNNLACRPARWATGAGVLSCQDIWGDAIFQYCNGIISLGKTLQCEAITLTAIPLCVVAGG